MPKAPAETREAGHFSATEGLPEAGRPAAPRDPWGSSADADHTHDPHEVTVQLDGVALQQSRRLKETDGSADASPASASAAGADASDRPVFVDESGRRSRRFRRLGIAVGLACAVYAVVIVVTLLSGSSDAPWLPVPGQKDDQPAGKVDTSPQPTPSVIPSGAAGVVPGTTPTADNGIVPTPGASRTAPGAGTASGGNGTRPGASADPGPTATRTTTGPGTGPSAPVSSDPVVDPSVSTSPDPSGPATTSPDPSPSTAGGGPGGPVADGPSEPSPIAVDPSGPATHSPSPEHIL
ncbi:hypothetical protein ACIQI8_16735 [Streptomyces sp. NPDC092369]|uniref:hypothetical protein n=1 Tax=Streptomyces sp. NPDC092369 TaxID=3366015 RepID=UPI003819398A